MGEYFGQGYEPVEYSQIAPAGDHMIQLGMPKTGTVGNGYSVVKIPIFIDGFPHHLPGDWTIFDAPTGDLDKLVQWNKDMTQFFDAFGIKRGNFNIAEWNGTRGRVRIDKDKGGYMKVRWAIPGFADKDFGSVPYEKVEPRKQGGGAAFQGQSRDPLPDELPPDGF